MTRLLISTFVAVFVMMAFALHLQAPSAVTPNAAPSSSPTPIATGAPPSHFSNGSETEIHRDSAGHFRLDVAVNGQDANFLIDTGADVVALTVADAERLGLQFDRNSFQPIGHTASGVGYGTRLKLDRLVVGGHELDNVDAVVMDGLSTNLLGQSALRRLGKVELQGDVMVIRES